MDLKRGSAVRGDSGCGETEVEVGDFEDVAAVVVAVDAGADHVHVGEGGAVEVFGFGHLDEFVGLAGEFDAEVGVFAVFDIAPDFGLFEAFEFLAGFADENEIFLDKTFEGLLRAGEFEGHQGLVVADDIGDFARLLIGDGYSVGDENEPGKQ